MKKQVDVSHYHNTEYLALPRFISFWHQIHEVMQINPSNLLEIGPGPGIVTYSLRTQNISVTTLDFADDIGANIVASVLNMPLEDISFDAVLCCQVLEHLPYEQFESALQEIHRVSRKHAVISLPHYGRLWTYQIHLPKLGVKKFGINLNFPIKEHHFDGQHYWEIGKKGFPLKRILTSFYKFFPTIRHYRVIENPFHHFFICSK